MNNDSFLKAIQAETESFAKAVATDEGQWIIKGFIDVYRNIYTISIDTKIVSKVLELLLFPMFVEFGKKLQMRLELSPQQNFYPDISFVHEPSGKKFALDIKTTYRDSSETVNGMTLGAFTGYFRNRTSTKNIRYPYNEYEGHYVLGVIYSQNKDAVDERRKYSLKDLQKIPSVIHDFIFFAQPKYKIATDRPGSGNTKNIGSCTKISELIHGIGPFSELGEKIYDDYWMFYLTKDMARALEIERAYTNLKSYLEYKKKGMDILTLHEDKIKQLKDEETGEDNQ
ncbi:MAG: restriction endonuclease [Candidatus Brocadiae bacterium]|nr:restriction endonuclease [Candidatus Brocadiia bacterium]